MVRLHGLFPLILAGLFTQLAGVKSQEPVSPLTAEAVAAAARPAVVVISTAGRSGTARSSGSGFIVSADGIIATNLHVIGEGRAFDIVTADRTRLTPKAILGFDRARDLALVQVAEAGLPALALGDVDAVRPGQPALAVGNPLGLGLSVASGTVAEWRELEGRKLLQVAIPIEPGSSGSPLLNLQGQVIGVIAIKSGASTAFAVPVNEVKALLEAPRAVAIERWLRLGALDSQAWRAISGGEWKQRAGRVVATGTGDGFGGRTLCLSQLSPPAADFDLAIEVKLEDEGGAAGLAFCSDGADKHYGFYPTNGSLRLTRFEGPDVFHWTILKTVVSSHYRPGEWNAIRVRLRGKLISCLVNGELAIELEDDGLRGGSLGLVKFRSPAAEFRGFRVASELPSETTSAAMLEKADHLITRFLSAAVASEEAVAESTLLGDAGLGALIDRAKTLERQAGNLRTLAESARRQIVLDELEKALPDGDEAADLSGAALLISRLDNAEVDVAAYKSFLDLLGREAGAAIAASPSAGEKFAALLRYFVEDLAFRGSSLEYYHRANSYLNEVLDDREGLPITLAVVFIELARRAGLNVVGIPLPRHFVVEHRPAEGERQLADVFGGKLISRVEAELLSGATLNEADFEPATKRQIILRMLNNLLSAAQRQGDLTAMVRGLDAIIRLQKTPDELGSARWARATLRFRLGDIPGARSDAEWLLREGPESLDRQVVEQLLRTLSGGN